VTVVRLKMAGRAPAAVEQGSSPPALEILGEE
jgi:hypothetical protein